MTELTHWPQRRLADDEIVLTPDASRTLIDLALDAAGMDVQLDAIVVRRDGWGDLVVYPDGSTARVGERVQSPAAARAAQGVVAAAEKRRGPLDIVPTPEGESHPTNGRVSPVAHQAGFPLGRREAPVDGPWQPYEIDGGFAAHHSDRDVFDTSDVYVSERGAWPRCWYLNEVAPSGMLGEVA